MRKNLKRSIALSVLILFSVTMLLYSGCNPSAQRKGSRKSGSKSETAENGDAENSKSEKSEKWSLEGLDEKDLQFIKSIKADKNEIERIREHYMLPGENEDQAILRLECKMRAKQIAIALTMYEATEGSFPPAYTVDSNGKPLHSWRVLLLPYINEGGLYKQIRLNEPWDSEYNKQFHSRIPRFYTCPAVKKTVQQEGLTSFKCIVGPNAFSSGEKGSKKKDITVSLRDVIAIAEVIPSSNWMEPVDILQEDLEKGINTSENEGLGSRHVGVITYINLDGQSDSVSDETDLSKRSKIKY